MAIKITELPAVTTSAGSDTKEVVQGGVSKKVTLDQDTTYIKANIATSPYVIGDLFYAGSTSSASRLADIATGNALISGGVGAAPSYGKITYGHMQTAGASKILGNPTGSTAAVSEITLGAGLSFVGTALTATADSNVTLQDAWANGDGTITSTNVKPVKFDISSTFTGAFCLSSDNFPVQLFTSTNGAVDEKNACFLQSGIGENPGFYGVLVNDALDDSINWIEVKRTGFIPDTVNFPNVTLQYDGDEVAKANQIIVTSWDGSTTPVAITAGTGIDIASGVISATGDASVDLQDAYDNGDGTITCDIEGMKPVVIRAGDATYKGAFELQGNIAAIQLFNCPSNASNEKIAAFIQDAGFFQGLLLSDDRVSNTEWLTVSRTGITVDSVNFPHGTLQYAGNEVATTSYTYSGRYTPTLTAILTVGSLTPIGALYTVTGNIVTVTAKFTCVPSDTSMVVGVSYPVSMGFNGINQSFLSGGSAIHNPGVDDGSMVAAGSQSGQNRANVEIQDIASGQPYTISVSFTGEIQ